MILDSRTVTNLINKDLKREMIAMKSSESFPSVILFLLLPAITISLQVAPHPGRHKRNPNLKGKPMNCLVGFDYNPTPHTKCYRFVGIEKSWFEAKTYCESIQGFLAEPKSSQELILMIKKWESAGLDANNNKKNFWLGGKCPIKTSGNKINECVPGWNWITSGDAVTIAWAKDSPTPHDSNHVFKNIDGCTMYGQPPQVGMWYRPCFKKQPSFVCQRNVYEDVSIPICPEDWTPHKDTCYKYDYSYTTWDDAKWKCHGMDAVLVEPRNRQLTNFIKTFNNFYKKQKVHGKEEEPEDFWIGLSYLSTEDMFQWESDASVLADAWNNWYQQPDSTTDDDGCVLFDAAGDGWNDVQCAKTHRFICQKPAENPTTLRDNKTYTILKFAPNKGRTFGQAKELCASNNESRLPEPRDRGTNQFLTNLTYLARGGRFYLGVTNIDDDWIWQSDNTPVNFTALDLKEPADKPGAECIMSTPSGETDHTTIWKPVDCTDKATTIICVKDVSSSSEDDADSPVLTVTETAITVAACLLVSCCVTAYCVKRCVDKRKQAAELEETTATACDEGDFVVEDDQIEIRGRGGPSRRRRGGATRGSPRSLHSDARSPHPLHTDTPTFHPSTAGRGKRGGVRRPLNHRDDTDRFSDTSSVHSSVRGRRGRGGPHYDSDRFNDNSSVHSSTRGRRGRGRIQ